MFVRVIQFYNLSNVWRNDVSVVLTHYVDQLNFSSVNVSSKLCTVIDCSIHVHYNECKRTDGSDSLFTYDV